MYFNCFLWKCVYGRRRVRFSRPWVSKLKSMNCANVERQWREILDPKSTEHWPPQNGQIRSSWRGIGIQSVCRMESWTSSVWWGFACVTLVNFVQNTTPVISPGSTVRRTNMITTCSDQFPFDNCEIWSHRMFFKVRIWVYRDGGRIPERETLPVYQFLDTSPMLT